MNYVLLIIGLFVIFASWGEKVGGGFVVLGIALAVFSLVKIFKEISSNKSENEFLSLQFVQAADYKHCYGGTAIAINKKEKKLLLGSTEKLKLYEFDQIREWEYKIYSGGSVVTGNLAGIAQNMNNRQQNENGSGFFVRVKDIDFPEWRIAFDFGGGSKSAEKEATKWMEIFSQFVKNDY